MNTKKQCIKCKTSKTVKNGKRSGKQRFLCRGCGYIWEHGDDKNDDNIEIMKLYHGYVADELKYRQLSQELGLSKTSIQYRLDKFKFDVFFVKTLIQNKL